MQTLYVTYHIQSSPADIQARAEGVALEQSVELPRPAVRDSFIERNIMGKVESIAPAEDDLYRVTIGFSAEPSPPAFTVGMFGSGAQAGGGGVAVGAAVGFTAVGGTAVGGTAVGGTAVGGTAVGGALVGGTGVAVGAGAHPATMASATTSRIAKRTVPFIFSSLFDAWCLSNGTGIAEEREGQGSYRFVRAVAGCRVQIRTCAAGIP